MNTDVIKNFNVVYNVPPRKRPFGFNKRHYFIAIPDQLLDLRREEINLKEFALDNDLTYHPLWYSGRGTMFYPFERKFSCDKKEIFRTKVYKMHNVSTIEILDIKNKKDFATLCKSHSYSKIQFTFSVVVEEKDLFLLCTRVILHPVQKE
jgi:hypothetical protein